MNIMWRAVVAFAFCAIALPAAALEVWRNGTAYTLDLRVTNGGTFTRQGVDRKFLIPGSSISGTFRLIQDNYAECSSLVAERRTGQAKNGYSRVLQSQETDRQCVVSLANPMTRMEMTSYYLRLDMCRCYSALHFVYPDSDSLFFESASRTMVSQLQSLSRKTGSAQSQSTANADQRRWSDLDSSWKEGIRILHKRGFMPEMAVAIQGNFFGDALAQGIMDQRLPGERGYDYIAHVFGIKEKDRNSYLFVQRSKQMVPAPDLAFDLESGRPFWKKGLTPQQMAKSISNCYKAVNYTTKCKLNFHAQMGCRMTDTWKRFCRKTATDKTFSEFGDLCFWTPKGDLPMMPASEGTEKTVMLPSNGVETNSAKKKTGTKKSGKKSAQSCDDGLLARYHGRF